ncbi:MAG: hypothetical protein JSU86_06450 [Phycisphaerales bacterium]|nr:MAG: hypothetical protein JSU86_06450 [Phycisphaerales bacterium]
MLRREIKHKWLPLVSCILLSKPVLSAGPGAGGAHVQMRLELELDRLTCVVHENLAFKVRMFNPNQFPVELRGFEMDSYIEPEVHLLLEDGKTLHLRHHPSDSAWTRTPVTIPGGGLLEKHRFLWNDNIASLAWPEHPGTFELRLDTHLSTARLVGESERRQIDWERPIAELRVRPAGPLDRQASDWLRGRLEEEQRRKTVPGIARDVTAERIRIYAEFLDRFPDSAYAAAIRWETAKLLVGHESTLKDEPVMVDLFDECLMFCLERGGAYAEEFVEWDRNRGGNGYLNLAIKHERWTLVKRIVDALDHRHPEDEAGKLWRHALVVGLRESGDAARRILKTIVEEFPEDRYAEAARGRIQDIDRGSWPPKPPDEEERLYKRAAREATRSPDNGRRMLVDVLERFPEGRYRTQIRALIDAIDDGTWPPKLPQPAEPDTP